MAGMKVFVSLFHVPAKTLCYWNWIALLTLAFTGSIGMTLVIIACAMHSCWWPMVVVLFYTLAPLPTLIARRQDRQYVPSPSCMDFAIFITMGIIVSSFALPIIFTRAPSKVIETDACYLTLAGNVVIYLTYIGFFLTIFQDDSYGL